MGAGKETSNYNESNHIEEGASYSEEYKCIEKSEPQYDGHGSGLKNISKEKRHRRKERKRNSIKNKRIKILGLNCAGIINKL